MLINVIGMGYIGLPTALMFATAGNKVVGTDINQNLIGMLQNGKITFEEKGLAELFDKARQSGIFFSNQCQSAAVYILAVPTPYDNESKKIDPLFVQTAFFQVLQHAPYGAMVVIESTISPRTIDRFIRPIAEQVGKKVGTDIHLIHAPERIIPGNMIFELVHNSRTIGADDPIIGERIKTLYATFCKGEIVVTDIRTAEMTKVVENTYRDVNIAFANELAKICRSDGMDVYEIIRIANKHPRVSILSPGPGVGGHCISVDPWFLVGDYPGLANLILTARNINDSMPEFVLRRVHTIMQEHKLTEPRRVGFYGLTYKENVDDTRESPTLQLLESMQWHLSHALVKVYDPFIKQQLVPNQIFNLEQFLAEVDLVVIMIAHSEIIENSALLNDKIVLDTRRCLNCPHLYHL